MAGRRFSILSMSVPAFAAATAAFSLLALGQLLPDSSVPAILPLAQQHLERAAALLNGPRHEDPGVLAHAETEADRALDASPARTDAWLTVAYIENKKAGRFTPKAAEALDRSYTLGPLDPDVSLWRLEFCFDTWPSLSKDLQNDAIRELSAVWTRPDKRDALKQIGAQLIDPAGRLAYKIQIALLERDEGDLRTGD